MSIEYLNAAIAYKCLTIYEKSVLILLSNRSNKEGICWPSIPKLCEEGCITRGSAIKAIKGLETKGLLKVSRAHRQSNTYKLLLPIESAGQTLPVRLTHYNGSSRRPQPSVVTQKNPLRSMNRWLKGKAPEGTKTPEEVKSLMAQEKAKLFRRLSASYP